MRILHILDHSLPLQSGYVIRTLGIVNQQRALGWEPVLLTSGKHYAPGPARERIGEMNVMMCVLHAIHERNIGLAGQYDRERHADHGDNTLKTGKPLPAQQDPPQCPQLQDSIHNDGLCQAGEKNQ